VKFLNVINDAESLALLLDAAKENMNLIGFVYCATWISRGLRAEIDFQCKLQRFGKGLFGSTSMPIILWPVILAPRAADQDGPPDALFYSFCQYFSSSTTVAAGQAPPTQELLLDQQHRQHHLRPTKRSRHS
jgi:hypothetical protein